MPRRPSRQSRLDTLAAGLRAQLEPVDNGWRQIALPGGLIIVLQRNAEHWRLALGRESVAPSDVEVDVCARAFQVPPGSEPTWSSKPRRIAKTNRIAQYHVAELTWREERHA